ncbi:replication protein A 32 kDa subunit A-like [Rutidosis leptorrhynchoides]|uniref:replication protein A 32 kDa subunit A-like n=1 Tax=Rutidosis leptorrhynchoides TaxID=125765 RepID=UPI003A997ECC
MAMVPPSAALIRPEARRPRSNHPYAGVRASSWIIIMFSGSQFVGGSQITNSPAIANRDTFGLIPLTIKQISEASHSGDDKSNFTISGAEVVNVSVVGMVFNKAEKNSYVTFTVADGTGNLECKTWLNEPFDKLQIEAISEGIYVHVDGHLKSFNGERHIDVFSVRPVTNFDEITFHFIACIHNHVRTTKDQKKQGNDRNVSENGDLITNTPIQNGTNASYSTISSELSSVHLNVDRLKGFDRMVLAFLQFPTNYEKERGIHIDEIAHKMKLPLKKIMESIRSLQNEGFIYSTIDDNHFQAICSS